MMKYAPMKVCSAGPGAGSISTLIFLSRGATVRRVGAADPSDGLGLGRRLLSRYHRQPNTGDVA